LLDTSNSSSSKKKSKQSAEGKQKHKQHIYCLSLTSHLSSIEILLPCNSFSSSMQSTLQSQAGHNHPSSPRGTEKKKARSKLEQYQMCDWC